MIIQSIKQAVLHAQNPVAKAIHHNAHFKVLAIGFKQVMIMIAHTAKWPSKLTVLEGDIQYSINGSKTQLNQYNEINIPVGEERSSEVVVYRICLLTQSNE